MRARCSRSRDDLPAGPARRRLLGPVGLVEQRGQAAPRPRSSGRRGRSRPPGRGRAGRVAGANAATRRAMSAKSPADSRRPVRGSARWASYPAETSTQVGCEGSDRRSHDLVERLEVDVAGGAGRERQVERRPRAPAARRCRRERPSPDRRRRTGGSTRRATRGSSQKMASVPLPWWASQSRTRTRSPCSARLAAATAMLLIRQNPIGRLARAWWPGGRTARKAASPSPRRSASIAASPAPAASFPARHEPVDARVSPSMSPPPAAQKRSSASRYSRGWTRLSSSEVASRGSMNRTASFRPAASGPRRAASSRRARSGWPGPVSCCSKAGSVAKRSIPLRYASRRPRRTAAHGASPQVRGCRAPAR